MSQTICRDVWAYHLLLLPEPVVATPLIFKRENENPADADSDAEDDGFPSMDFAKSGHGDQLEESSSESSSDEDKDQSASKGSRPLDPDPELAKLLREMSESDTESTSTDSESGAKQKRRERMIYGKKPLYGSPAANIAVLMIGCWMLRVPVLYMDFIRIIESYELPYLETIRLLDDSWRDPLTAQTWSALSPSV